MSTEPPHDDARTPADERSDEVEHEDEPTASGHSTADSQAERNVEDESPS